MEGQYKLTISQAIAEGYTLCGLDGPEYQSLTRIEDLTSDEILFDYTGKGKKLLIADKEPRIHTINAKDLMDQAIDDYYNDEDFSMDDTGEIDRAIRKEKELFEEFATKLNAIYATKQIYMLTKIELVPDGAEE